MGLNRDNQVCARPNTIHDQTLSAARHVDVAPTFFDGGPETAVLMI
jgi:hypothetical protein